MEPWLEQLRGEGRLDSIGHFEVDTARQLELLRSYRLREPRQAILAVVRAAVLVGAAWMSIQTGAHESEAEFPGTVAPSEEFSGLLSWLDQPRNQRFQLVLALNAALTFADVEVTSWDGQSCARLRLSPDRAARSEVGREPPWREPRTRVRFINRARPSIFARTGEHDLLAQSCPWAPLKLTLNHQVLGAPPFGHRQAPELRIYARHAPPGGAIGLSPTQAHHCLHRTVDNWPGGGEFQEGIQGLLVAALSLHPSPGALIKEGVRLSELPLHAIVSVSGMAVDLTEENLLENERTTLDGRLAQWTTLLR